MLAYDKSWDAVSSERTLLSGRYKEGRAEGEAKGRAEGLAEGRAEGEAKGRAEERAEMVQNLHQLGIPREQIAIAAKLSHEEVQKILEK